MLHPIDVLNRPDQIRALERFKAARETILEHRLASIDSSLSKFAALFDCSFTLNFSSTGKLEVSFTTPSGSWDTQHIERCASKANINLGDNTTDITVFVDLLDYYEVHCTLNGISAQWTEIIASISKRIAARYNNLAVLFGDDTKLVDALESCVLNTFTESGEYSYRESALVLI